jgi:HEPN domain-containing protein
MNELIESFTKRAAEEIRTSRIHYDNYNYPACVSCAQTAVELTLKALLKKFTGDYPRKHDASAELGLAADKLPEGLKEKVPRLCFISRLLSAWREPSIYGEELRQTPPEHLLGRKEAELAISYAEEVRSVCFSYLLAS